MSVGQVIWIVTRVNLRDQLLHLLARELSVALDDAVLDEPLLHLRIVPSIPDLAVDVIVVALHESDELLTALRRRVLEDAVLDEPLVKVRIGPCLPGRVGNSRICLLHLREKLVTGGSGRLDDAVLLQIRPNAIVVPPKCIVRPDQLINARTPLT